jgi:hypothetical protein
MSHSLFVTPTRAIDDARNMVRIDAELCSDSPSITTSGVHQPHGANLIDSQTTGSTVPASLYRHVVHVFVVRSNKQMLRVAAMPNVASMADEHPIGNRPDQQLIRKSVGRSNRTSEAASTITSNADTPCPQPTTSRTRCRIEFRQELFLRLLMGYSGHVNLLKRLAGPRAFTAPRGISVPQIIPQTSTNNLISACFVGAA